MATPFSDLYEAVRAATGNDDPVVGTEVMPDSRIDVLIRTAVPHLRGYSRVFEAASCQQNETSFVWELFPTGQPTATLKETTLTAIALVAAHRYYIGLGNRAASNELFAMISDLGVVASGEPVLGYKAPGVQPESFEVL